MEKLKWKCVYNLKNSIFNKLYMSGSAALSAAKNRRTASAPPAPGGVNHSQKNDRVTEQQTDGPKNPLQILYIHEMRLNKLETDKPDADKSDTNKEEIISFLSDKVLLLEKQCSELKEELNKVMSFAMETNRAFLLYKNDKEQQHETS